MDTALLVIDIQNDYLPDGANPLFEANQAAVKAADVIGFSRRKGWPVIYIQHVANRPGATFFVPGSRGVWIANEVRPISGDKIIVKHYPNSFRKTELGAHLKSLGVKNLIVCGMMTHMCVDATVRAAKDFHFEIQLIGDACATRDLKINGEVVKAADVQKSFLAALSYFYANVINADDFIEKYK
jgi:nicotinamidase-related amidase